MSNSNNNDSNNNQDDVAAHFLDFIDIRTITKAMQEVPTCISHKNNSSETVASKKNSNSDNNNNNCMSNSNNNDSNNNQDDVAAHFLDFIDIRTITKAMQEVPCTDIIIHKVTESNNTDGNSTNSVKRIKASSTQNNVTTVDNNNNMRMLKKNNTGFKNGGSVTTTSTLTTECGKLQHNVGHSKDKDMSIDHESIDDIGAYISALVAPQDGDNGLSEALRNSTAKRSPPARKRKLQTKSPQTRNSAKKKVKENAMREKMEQKKLEPRNVRKIAATNSMPQENNNAGLKSYPPEGIK